MRSHCGINGVTQFGDQGFISATLLRHGALLHWQDILPSAWFLEFSYLDKINPAIANNSYDKSVRVCYSLGYPKFPQWPDLPIVRAHWHVDQ